MMDRSKQNRRMTTMLECSICLDTYTKPKVLPCGHTFCLSCLQGLPQDADGITCPRCMRQHKVPDDGMQQFPDNIDVIGILDVLLSHTQKSVCEACGENGDNEFCDHCQKDVCAKCYTLHKSSLSEIKIEIDMMHKMFYSLANVNKICKNKAMWQTSSDNIVQERNQMEKYFTKCIEVLDSRRKVHNNYFDTLDKLHNIFLDCTDLQASKLLGDKLCEDLMRSGTTCTNNREFENIKSSVSEVLELLQLMLTMEAEDSFTFVGDVTTFTQLSSIGDVMLGGDILEIRGEPKCGVTTTYRNVASQTSAGPSCEGPSDTACLKGQIVVAGDQSSYGNGNPADGAAAELEIKCPQVNYRDKTNCITIIPARGATGDRCLRCPTGVEYCSITNTILVADSGNSRIMRYDMNGRNGRRFDSHGDTGFGEYRPFDVATSQTGLLFVTDNQQQRILIFSRDGTFVNSFGSRGTGDGQFGEVRGITCHNSCVLVCDDGNRCVTMVTEDGVHIRHILTGQSKPQFVAVGPGDTIYVTFHDDTGARYHSNVRVYRWDGTPVRQFAVGEGTVGAKPSGITVDQQGYICVALYDQAGVGVYNPRGELYTIFTKLNLVPENKVSFNLYEPLDVNIRDPQGLVHLPDGRIGVVCNTAYNPPRHALLVL